MKKISVFFVSLCMIFTSAFAQYSTPGTPYSLKNKNVSFNVPQRELSKIDHSALQKEDVERAGKDALYRVGIVQSVNLNMQNSGRWDVMPNGDRLWRISIKSEDAVAVSFIFSQFDIPTGGEVYVYSPDFQQIIGKFDARSVLLDGSFYTQDILGDEMILEYYEPADVAYNGTIAISGIDHTYRGHGKVAKGYHGDAIGDCHINTICPEGDNWRDQINSVVMIKLTANNETFMCSGAMINNTRQDNTPYVFTADHCYESNALWRFFFGYERLECEATTGGVYNRMAIGADIIARGNRQSSSDFMLMKITGELRDVITENLYFAGWDRSASLPAVGAGIHHPGGDYKKISIPRLVVNGGSPYNKFWAATWYPKPNNKGVTEGGSSGSPLFNASKLIVGSLCCGSSSCEAGIPEDTQGPSGYDYYGKLSNAWTNGDTPLENKKIGPWLDPLNTGNVILGGKYYNDVVAINEYAETNGSFNVVPNPSNGMVTLKGNFSEDEAICSVYTLLGQKVYSSQIQLSSTSTLDMTSLNNGAYIVEINAGKKIYRTKMVIAR